MTDQIKPIPVATTSAQISEQVKGLAIRYQELAAAAHKAAAACRDYDGTAQADEACNEATFNLSMVAANIDKYVSSCAGISTSAD